MKQKNLIIAICVPIVYFSVLWMIPWGDFPESSISFSYVFDLIFALSVFWIYKPQNFLGRFSFHGATLRLLLTIILGVLCNSIINSTNSLISPFGYIQNITIQLLFMAPFFEELVFRGAFYQLFEKLNCKPIFKVLVNSLLFSFSHAFAFSVLPEQFHNFIFFQIGYTFIFGWLCTKSRERSEGIIEPILLHFVFNFIFYLATN